MIRRLKFWNSVIHLPVAEMLPLAKHAEDLGFEGVMSPDHLVWWGEKITSKYPFNSTGDVWWPEEAHWPDPWVSAAAMAAITTRIRFGHHVFVLPLRDPVNVAKAVATTAAVAGGRVIFAFGVGWMREEFDLVGQQFSRRGRRTDEMLDVLKKLWSGERVSHEGDFYNFTNVSMRPFPPEPIPLIAGGHSEPALRRAATRCDGWLGASRFTPDGVVSIVDKLNEYRADAGHGGKPFDILISLGKRDHNPDTLGKVADLGVTGLMVAPWTIFPNDRIDSLVGKMTAMDDFAKAFMTP